MTKTNSVEVCRIFESMERGFLEVLFRVFQRENLCTETVDIAEARAFLCKSLPQFALVNRVIGFRRFDAAAINNCQQLFNKNKTDCRIDFTPYCISGAETSKLIHDGFAIQDFSSVLFLPATENLSIPDGIQAKDISIRSVSDSTRAAFGVAFQAHFHEPWEWNRPLPFEFFRVGEQLITEEGVHATIASSNETVLGWVVYARVESCAYLTAAWISPKARGKGLYRLLITSEARRMFAEDIDLIVASTIAGAPAQRALEAIGFRLAYNKINLRSNLFN
jgi:ribosomal protein S18 acetylase RimI-like enzyme